MLDDDGDDVMPTAYLDDEQSLPDFIRFQGSALKFTPLTGQHGVYVIKVKLTDSGNPELSTTYSFVLTVIDPA